MFYQLNNTLFISLIHLLKSLFLLIETFKTESFSNPFRILSNIITSSSNAYIYFFGVAFFHFPWRATVYRYNGGQMLRNASLCLWCCFFFIFHGERRSTDTKGGQML